MIIDTFEQPLRDLGLTPRNYQALRVLPLIHVAWADGKLTEEEKRQVLEFSRTSLGLDIETMQLVHHWLERPPSHESVRNGVSLLRRAAHAIDEVDFGCDELLSTLWEAETLTRRAAFMSGAPYEPSVQDQMALLELAELLGIDSGTPWIGMLRDLGGQDEVAATLGGSIELERPADRASLDAPADAAEREQRADRASLDAPADRASSREDRAKNWRAAVIRHRASVPDLSGT
jgi:hypothetical protein